MALNKLSLLQKAHVQNKETLKLFRKQLKQTVLAKNIKMPSRSFGFRGQVFKLKWVRKCKCLITVENVTNKWIFEIGLCHYWISLSLLGGGGGSKDVCLKEQNVEIKCNLFYKMWSFLSGMIVREAVVFLKFRREGRAEQNGWGEDQGSGLPGLICSTSSRRLKQTTQPGRWLWS